MKLDPRIIEGKKPLDCVDVENETVKSFIGKKGYFSDLISDFSDISDLTKDMLKAVSLNVVDNMPYKTKYAVWGYFLPAEWVSLEEPEKSEEPEEIYRAFSLNEFSELYAIGDVVTFRLKDCEVIEQSMLIGFQSSHDEDIPGNGYVLIGNCRYGFMELFNNYELKYLDHWQPFGVIDEDKE